MIPNQAGILVIEPVEIVRQQIASILNGGGFKKVTGLATPEEALQLLETKPCHLIFSEWHLPPHGGLEFLKKIRSHSYPRVRDICFVVLTADETRASVEEAMAAGADDYILKPLNGNQLQSRINSMLMKVPADQ